MLNTIVEFFLVQMLAASGDSVQIVTTTGRSVTSPDERWCVGVRPHFVACRIRRPPMSANAIAHEGRLLLTAPEASRSLSISLRKLWALTASNQIPHVRIGRCVRYPVDDLQRWIAQQKEGGDSR